MTVPNLQHELFQYLKARVPTGIHLAEDLSSVLSISSDSAYRRIRCEKPLSFEEIYKICVHYHLSLDHLFDLKSDSFVFSGNFVQPSGFDFEKYLQGIQKNLKYMLTFKERTMYYLCKDIPLFHHFHFKELAAFKYYFWMRAYIQHPEFSNRKFRLKDYPDQIWETGKSLLESYNQFESTEIWNIENINSTLRQIEYYYDAGAFQSDDELWQLFDALEKMLVHLEQQADEGYKFFVDNPQEKMGKYQMYYNEVFLGDNSILVIVDKNKIVHLVHSLFNYMATTDVRFCDYTSNYVHNLIRKSTLISTVSEKERARFFKYLRNRISKRKNSLKA